MSIEHPGRMLSIDLETTGTDRLRDFVSVVGVYEPATENTWLFVCQQGKIPNQCRELLEAADTWITHWGSCFDLHFLKRQGVRLPKEHYDTLIGELCFAVEGRSDFSANLANTMKRRIGEDNKLTIDHSDWGLNMTGLTEKQVEYIKADLLSLHRIREVQIEEAKKRKMYEALVKEQELTLGMAQIMGNGLAFDRTKFNSLMNGYEIEAKKQLGICRALYGQFFNPSSPDQTIKALEKYDIYVKNTEVHTLMEWATRDTSMGKVIMPIIHYRQAAHKVSMYGPKKMAKWVKDERLYGRINQLGASTTRMTSADPNIQQIPVVMREMIGGEDDKFVISPDYSQIEVRVKAHISNDPDMMDALNAEDFHLVMAQSMFPGREITKESPLRKTGKGGTFTLNFDGTYRAIQRAAIKEGELISDLVSQGMVDGYYARFPAQWDFHEIFRDFQYGQKDPNGKKDRKGVRRLKPTPKRLTFPWGHYRGYPIPKATQMINNYVQGFASIGMKEAALEMLRRGLLKYVGLLLHDETVATSVPANEAEDYSMELEECMIVGMSKIIPQDLIKVEVKSSRNWSK